MEYPRRSSIATPPARGRGRPRKQNKILAEAYLPPQQNSFGQYQRVWIVFTDECRIHWLKCLRPGFRHCFALLNDGDHWLAVEPLASCMEVTVLPSPADFNLPEWLRGQGHRVVDLAAQHLVPMIADVANQYQSAGELQRLQSEFGADRWPEVARQLQAWGNANLPPEAARGLSRHAA